MRRLVTLRILWVAILSSSLLMFSVLLFIANPVALEPTFVTVLAAAALAAAAGSFVLPRILHGMALTRFAPVSRDEDDPVGMPGVAKRRVAERPGDALEAALLAYQAPFVIGLALSEAVALFGFVLGFIGAPLSVVVPFFVAGWVLIAARFPTVERAVGPAERAARIRIPRPSG